MHHIKLVYVRYVLGIVLVIGKLFKYLQMDFPWPVAHPYYFSLYQKSGKEVTFVYFE